MATAKFAVTTTADVVNPADGKLLLREAVSRSDWTLPKASLKREMEMGS